MDWNLQFGRFECTHHCRYWMLIQSFHILELKEIHELQVSEILKIISLLFGESIFSLSIFSESESIKSIVSTAVSITLSQFRSEYGVEFCVLLLETGN